MDKKKLIAMKDEVENKFEEVAKKRGEVVEQLKTVQDNIRQIDDELKRLQGEYRSIEKIAKDAGVELGKPKEIKADKPKPKKKK